MNLAVSNLAWDFADDDRMLGRLAELGVTGLELAPAKLFGDLRTGTEEQARDYREKVRSAGLEIVAFQAYLFGRPELQLFVDDARDDFIAYTKRALDLASWCGARRIVYGAPKSRATGGRPEEECLRIATEAFRDISRYAASRDTIFCLEPNPPAYSCDFASNAAEAAELVRAVDSPGCRLHLDITCMTLAGDDIGEAITANADILAHFHASEPQLGDFTAPGMDHRKAAAALRKAGYEGWVSIEMRQPEDPMAGVTTAVNFVREAYDL